MSDLLPRHTADEIAIATLRDMGQQQAEKVVALLAEVERLKGELMKARDLFAADLECHISELTVFRPAALAVCEEVDRHVGASWPYLKHLIDRLRAACEETKAP